MQPTATTLRPVSCAAISASMESRFAASTKPQVLTRTASASSASGTTAQPASSSRAASSSESTSLRAQPSVTNDTERVTSPGYGLAGRSGSGELHAAAALDRHVGDDPLRSGRSDVTAVGHQVDSRGVADQQPEPPLVAEDLGVTLAEDALVELVTVERPDLQPGAVGHHPNEGSRASQLCDGGRRRRAGGGRSGRARPRCGAAIVGGLP